MSKMILLLLSNLAQHGLLSSGMKTFQHEEWHWTWSCVDGICVKSENPIFENELHVGKTLEYCRLTCGPAGPLWPIPRGNIELGRDIANIHPEDMVFDLEDIPDADSKELISRMADIFVSDLAASVPVPYAYVHVPITIKMIVSRSSTLTLNWDTDESYTLAVSSTEDNVSVVIRASSAYGARHGLQTLAQLTIAHEVGGSNGNGKGVVTSVLTWANVTDEPAYPHRGVLLDTSRHYLPVEDIKRTIDTMRLSKLNVLHWHATDTHSFPLLLPRVSQLARYGAYSSEKVYTGVDMNELIKYGRERGVRLIMEIDAPAHMGAGWQWGEANGLGALALCVNAQPWRKYCVQPPCGQLNPLNRNAMKILRDLYSDLVDIFPIGEVFHMGGDEVFFPCWNSSEEIIRHLEEEGLDRSEENFFKLWSQFQNRSAIMLDHATGIPRSQIILWSSHLTQSSIIDRFLDKERYIIESWVESSNPLPAELLAKGYRVIMATKDAWYLDHGFWGKTQYHKWRTVYDNRIPDASEGVLGGEVAIWTEYADGSTLDGRLWPRSSALAERLWSNPPTDSSKAQNRLFHHRERLVARGVLAEAVIPEWCYQNDGNCD